MNYYDSYIIYGWKELYNGYKIDNDWLLYYGIGCYTSSIINNNACDVIYGSICTIDKKTGKIIIDEYTKEQVNNAFNNIQYYNKRMKSIKNNTIGQNRYTFLNLEYYSGLYGDNIWDEFITYNPCYINTYYNYFYQ